MKVLTYIFVAYITFIIDCVALAKQGDNALGSVCPSVTTLTPNNHHYQSKVIVCVLVISELMQIIAQMRLIGFQF